MKRSAIWIFAVLFAVSSCTVYKEYPIDVFKPGEISVPPTVENVALAYRNFKYAGDTLQHFYKDNHQLRRAKNDPKNLDSLLASYCLRELASNLKSKNIYDQIHIFPEIYEPHHGSKLPTLDFGLVGKLTEASNTDLLVSLETFSYFYSQYDADYNVPKSREVITAAVWAVYDPLAEKIVERKTMIDTVFWNSYDEKGNYIKNGKLPPRTEALRIAAQLAGENYSKRFFASWVKVNRMYSVPPLPDFEAAEKYLLKNDWDNAILLWKRYAADKHGKMAINARYNIALGYEMKDDLESAWKWLASAQTLASNYRNKEELKRITVYQKILAKRFSDIEKLEPVQE